VRIEGLVSNPELNGRSGVVCSERIQDNGRWAVVVDSDASRPSCTGHFRPTNLSPNPVSLHLCAAAIHLASASALVTLECARRRIPPPPCSSARTPPPPPLALARAAAQHTSLRQRQRLRITMGCGGTAKVAVWLSLSGCGPASVACSSSMHIIVRRVAAGLAAATPEALHCKACRLCCLRQFARAACEYEQAIALDHAPSHAHLAGLLLRGRCELPRNQARAFELAGAGARTGCLSCAGVLACCYLHGHGCARDEARAMQLARVSAAAGSSYGQCASGYVQRHGCGGTARDYAAALQQYGLAAAQGLDEAQFWLGDMYFHGKGVDDDFEEAVRWYVGLLPQWFCVTFCACTSLQASRGIPRRAAGCRCVTPTAGALLLTKERRRHGAGAARRQATRDGAGAKQAAAAVCA
jgi:TPR repeat protein